ncbi:MAG: hypothetical protein ABIH76_08495 [Candidatus Bathyarchaeota archaeon]
MGNSFKFDKPALKNGKYEQTPPLKIKIGEDFKWSPFSKNKYGEKFLDFNF